MDFWAKIHTNPKRVQSCFFFFSCFFFGFLPCCPWNGDPALLASSSEQLLSSPSRVSSLVSCLAARGTETQLCLPRRQNNCYLLLLVFLLWFLALLPVERRPSSACLVVRTTVIFSALRTLFVWKQNHSHYAGHLEHCPKVEAISDHHLVPSFLWDKAGDLFMVVGVQLQVVEQVVSVAGVHLQKRIFSCRSESSNK